MSWLNTVGRSVSNGVQGLASGVWAAVATPFVHTPLRPVTKQAVKGGLWVARGAQSLVEVTQQEWRALVAEAEAEAHAGTVSLDAEAGVGGNGAAADLQSPPAGSTTELADLTAVKGIGDDYARLLRVAGIESIDQLAHYEPEALRASLLEANEAHGIVGRVPSADRIRGWLERAGEHTD